jgi:hypothetical protein
MKSNQERVFGSSLAVKIKYLRVPNCDKLNVCFQCPLNNNFAQ